MKTDVFAARRAAEIVFPHWGHCPGVSIGLGTDAREQSWPRDARSARGCQHVPGWDGDWRMVAWRTHPPQSLPGPLVRRTAGVRRYLGGPYCAKEPVALAAGDYRDGRELSGDGTLHSPGCNPRRAYSGNSMAGTVHWRTLWR